MTLCECTQGVYYPFHLLRFLLFIALVRPCSSLARWKGHVALWLHANSTGNSLKLRATRSMYRHLSVAGLGAEPRRLKHAAKPPGWYVYAPGVRSEAAKAYILCFPVCKEFQTLPLNYTFGFKMCSRKKSKCVNHREKEKKAFRSRYVSWWYFVIQEIRRVACLRPIS